MNRQVNNAIYAAQGHLWWDEASGEFASLRYLVNPVRWAYCRRVLASGEGGPWRRVLDVGCGGGLLAEEFARAGYAVTGVDPAAEGLAAARAHAAAEGLAIDYRVAAGEALPFTDGAFDVVACCDVLEHVDDVAQVLGECARVLRPGGCLLYDTINRTLRSWVGVIKVMQDWRATAFASRDSHLWAKFIRPAELAAALRAAGLEPGPMRGLGPSVSPLTVWRGFRAQVQGRVTWRELGERLAFGESEDLSASYLGFAVKPG